jgi:hypothetical protein
MTGRLQELSGEKKQESMIRRGRRKIEEGNV